MRKLKMAGRPPLRIGDHGRITRKDLGDGTWLARCGYRDLDGITRRIERTTPVGCVDEYGAKAEASLRDALATRRPPGTGNITGATTLGELLDRYLRRCREDGELAPRVALNSVLTDAVIAGAIAANFSAGGRFALS